jgi:hypothetical protein
MEYGQQMNQAKDNAKLSFYQNPGYQLERRNKKTFILKFVAEENNLVVTNNTTINKTLREPLIIDRLSDIYLESFLTFHDNPQDGSATTPGLNLNNTGGNILDRSAFVLKINEFNNQGNSNEGNIFNKIVIPHEIPNQEDAFRKAHKSRKLNYICSMNPTTLSNLTGTITALDGTTGLFRTNDMFLAEFVIVARD